MASANDSADEKAASTDSIHLDLNDTEAEVLRQQIDMPESSDGYLAIYRYASPLDFAIMAFSAVMAGVTGTALPLMTVVLGSLVGQFSDFTTGGRAALDEFTSSATHNTLYFVYIGVAALVSTAAFVLGYSFTGQRIAGRMRTAYLAALLRQNVGFFDGASGAGEVSSRITADMSLVQDGVSQKIGLTVQGLAGFAAAIIIAFTRSWRLAAVLLCQVVSIVVAMAVVGGKMRRAQMNAIQSYGRTASFAEEIIGSMRNVAAYGSQARFLAKYTALLGEPQRHDFVGKTLLGVFLGSLMFIQQACFALSFWQGQRFLKAGDATVAEILTTTYAMALAGVQLALAAPYIGAFASAGAAANRILATIKRQPPIDLADDKGDRPDEVHGEIEFRDVKLVYPSRQNLVVLEAFNLKAEAGKVTAVVGPSGSGKSTLISLLERFYSPLSGQILFDGRDIKDLSLPWLRAHMSLVSQEPFLFNTTIFENICFGLIGTPHEHADPATKTALVESAAKMANAHGFISELPRGYATPVGERGSLLSGGQRQRIAIARAVACDPRVLLLDEATAALDTRSESAVQAALHAASKGRTTVVIAHRLSTVRAADKIVVVDGGRIVEEGTHESLIDLGGVYAGLVTAQELQGYDGGKGGGGAAASSSAAEDAAKDRGVLVTDSSDAEDDEEAAGLSTAAAYDMRLEKTKTGASKRSSTGLADQPAAAKASLWQLVRFVWRLNGPESRYLALGLFGSFLSGSAYPVGAIFFGNATMALSDPRLSTGGHDVPFWSGMLFMLAGVLLFSYLLHEVPLAVASAALCRRAREHAFKAILRQDLAFFSGGASADASKVAKNGKGKVKKSASDDDDGDATGDNTSGALTAFLSTQAQQLNGLSGSTLGAVSNSFWTVVAAVAIAISFGWKLGLVGTSIMPLLILVGYLRFRVVSDLERRNTAPETRAAGVAAEAVGAIRTVASLGMEAEVVRHYERELGGENARTLAQNAVSAVLLGLGNTGPLFASALMFWYGGVKLIGSGEYTITNFFVGFAAIVWGAQAAGSVFSHAPDVAGGEASARRLLGLVSTVPAIDVDSDEGDVIGGGGGDDEKNGGGGVALRGDVALDAVDFAYPLHPARRVLKDVSLGASFGRFVALVGASGSGKSSVLNLVERFFDVDSGAVSLDGKDIRAYRLRSLRRQMALVEQDAVLYNGSIRDNIISDDESVGDTAIEAACREANIWEFVQSLPEGLSTAVGARGSRVSGGQKQRLAIARALLRKPAILLLDEATSALDSESEKVVQRALESASQGRTTIAVAHRLSSIAHADRIFVFEDGRVMESGSHKELMARRGRYWEYVGLQDLGKTE